MLVIGNDDGNITTVDLAPLVDHYHIEPLPDRRRPATFPSYNARAVVLRDWAVERRLLAEKAATNTRVKPPPTIQAPTANLS